MERCARFSVRFRWIFIHPVANDSVYRKSNYGICHAIRPCAGSASPHSTTNSIQLLLFCIQHARRAFHFSASFLFHVTLASVSPLTWVFLACARVYDCVCVCASSRANFGFQYVRGASFSLTHTHTYLNRTPIGYRIGVIEGQP